MVDLILFVSALRVPRAVTRLTVYRAPQHFVENHILKIFAPQNVESEKSDRSLGLAVFYLFSLCYFTADSMLECSNLWILGWWLVFWGCWLVGVGW